MFKLDNVQKKTKTKKKSLNAVCYNKFKVEENSEERKRRLCERG